MRILSLLQPHATLTAIGAKVCHTATQDTTYRGLVALHAFQAQPRQARMLSERSFIADPIERAGFCPDRYPRNGLSPLPFGAIVGIARLEATFMTAELFDIEGIDRDQASFEYMLGDWRPGRFAWRFTEPVLLGVPVPVVGGRTGLWDVPPDVETAIRLQVDLPDDEGEVA
jgi:hypothetical protein